jgi:hypothetical protein
MAKKLEIKIRETKDLGADGLAFARLCDLGHDFAFEIEGQGWTSQEGLWKKMNPRGGLIGVDGFLPARTPRRTNLPALRAFRTLQSTAGRDLVRFLID